MKLCKKCIKAIDGEADFTWDGERDKPLPVLESECEFWVHYAFNKILGYLGWVALTDDERDKLYKRFETEAPGLMAELDRLMSTS